MSRRPAKSRSGTTLTQAERRERGVRVVVSVTLSPEAIERLDELTDWEGVSRSAMVEGAIADRYARRYMRR